MTRLTDETLVAMVDGALTPEERLVTERTLEADPEQLRSLLLMRLSAMSIRAAFSGPEFEAVPERLRRSVSAPGSWTPAAACWGWLGAATGRRPVAAGLGAARIGMTGMGAAALALAAVLGWQLAGRPQSPNLPIVIGDLPAGSEIVRVLDRTDDGMMRPASGTGHAITVVATATDRAGRLCRAVEIAPRHDAGAGDEGSLVVACRSGTDRWTVVGAAAVIETASSDAAGGAATTLAGLFATIGAAVPSDRTEYAPPDQEKVER